MSVGPAYEAFNDTNHRREVIRRALPPKPGLALDLGAGTGWLSKELAGRGWSVVAVEADPQAAALCVAEGVEVAAKRLTFSDLTELLAHPWDLIAGLNFLHHTNDPRAVLELMLGSNTKTVLIQIPDRIEHGNKAVAGSHYLAPLYDIALAREPAVLGWGKTNLTECARRPILMWDRDLTVGTVVDGNGYTTLQWSEVGELIAAELNLELTVGSLNLELERPIEAIDITPILDTEWGPVLGVEVLAGGVPAVAVRMPNSDRGPLFTELVAVDHLREALELKNGDRVPVRFTGRG